MQAANEEPAQQGRGGRCLVNSGAKRLRHDACCLHGWQRAHWGAKVILRDAVWSFGKEEHLAGKRGLDPEPCGGSTQGG